MAKALKLTPPLSTLYDGVEWGLVAPGIITRVWPINPYLALRAGLNLCMEDQKKVVANRPARVLIYRPNVTHDLISPPFLKLTSKEVDQLIPNTDEECPKKLRALRRIPKTFFTLLRQVEKGRAPLKLLTVVWPWCPNLACAAASIPKTEQMLLIEPFPPIPKPDKPTT